MVTSMETLDVMEVKFCLGRLFVTPGVVMELSPMEVLEALGRHAHGDWGDVGECDWKENDRSVREGSRLVSSHRGGNGTKFWVITEHDRSATTVLLPQEY
jgi:hypothetical protein